MSNEGVNISVENNIGILVLIAGIPSVLSTITIIVFYYRIKTLQVIEFFLIVNMQTGDLIRTAAMVCMASWSLLLFRYFTIPTNEVAGNYQVCIGLGFLKVFGGLMSFLWTFNISYLLNKTVSDPDYNYQNSFMKIRVITYIVPLIFAIIPFLDNSYGYVDLSMKQTNCFIMGGYDQTKYNVTRFGCFYFPLWLIFIYSLYTSVKVFKYLNSQTNHPVIRNRILHLFLYPLVLFFCWIWVSIYRLLNIFGIYNDFLETIIFFFTNIYGFANSLIYGYYAISNRIKKKETQKTTISYDVLDCFTLSDKISYELLQTSFKQALIIQEQSSLTIINKSEEIQFSLLQT